MVSLQDIKGVWNNVEDFFKVITPKHDKIKELEEKIKLSFHYVLMIVFAIISLVIVLYMKSLIFANGAIFFFALIACMKNLCSEKRDEKKWYSFWFLFVLTIFNPLLDKSSYIKMFKFFFLMYLALFDDCVWIDDIINVIYEQACSLFNLYVEKCCKEHSD